MSIPIDNSKPICSRIMHLSQRSSSTFKLPTIIISYSKQRKRKSIATNFALDVLCGLSCIIDKLSLKCVQIFKIAIETAKILSYKRHFHNTVAEIACLRLPKNFKCISYLQISRMQVFLSHSKLISYTFVEVVTGAAMGIIRLALNGRSGCDGLINLWS